MFGWAAYNFDKFDVIFKNPLTDQYSSECEQLDLLLKNENKMMGCHKQIRAINALVDLLVGFVFHIERIVRLNTVNYDLLRKLNSESVLINCNLFYIVTTSNFDTGFSH